MARDRVSIVEAAEGALESQLRELEVARDRQLRAVVVQTATGSGHLDSTFGLDRKFRLLFVRCHFSGDPGTAALTFFVDSGVGSAYDARLFAITQAGVNKDVHLRIGEGDNQDPSPWTFQSADRLRLQWTNPSVGNITWGVEVGMAMTP